LRERAAKEGGGGGGKMQNLLKSAIKFDVEVKVNFYRAAWNADAV